MRRDQGKAGPSSRERSRRAVLATAILAAVYCGGSFLAGFLETRGSPAAVWLRALYAPVCHQLPARSLSLGTGHVAVCARCTGLHLGGVLGLFAGAAFVWPGWVRPRPSWLALSLAPLLIDVTAVWLGLPSLSNLPRAAASVPAGLVAGMFLAVGVADWFDMRPSGGGNHPAVRRTGLLEEFDG